MSTDRTPTITITLHPSHGWTTTKPVVWVQVPCAHGRTDCPACGRIVVLR